jgi:hypothetical protein
MLGDLVFSGTDIRKGLDADKPVTPSPGDQYVATDSEIMYVCYTDGEWAKIGLPVTPHVDVGQEINFIEYPDLIYKDGLVEKVSYPFFCITIDDMGYFDDVRGLTIGFDWRRDASSMNTYLDIYLNDERLFREGVSPDDGGTTFSRFTFDIAVDIEIGDVIELQIENFWGDPHNGSHVKNVRLTGNLVIIPNDGIDGEFTVL